jgi:hypothetical protein
MARNASFLLVSDCVARATAALENMREGAKYGARYPKTEDLLTFIGAFDLLRYLGDTEDTQGTANALRLWFLAEWDAELPKRGSLSLAEFATRISGPVEDPPRLPKTFEGLELLAQIVDCKAWTSEENKLLARLQDLGRTTTPWREVARQLRGSPKWAAVNR